MSPTPTWGRAKRLRGSSYKCPRSAIGHIILTCEDPDQINRAAYPITPAVLSRKHRPLHVAIGWSSITGRQAAILLPRHPDGVGVGFRPAGLPPPGLNHFEQLHAGMNGPAVHTVHALGVQSHAGLCGSAGNREEPLSSQARGKTHTQLGKADRGERQEGLPRQLGMCQVRPSFRKQSGT